ncbi:MAG: DUF3592 domain-containing protein [Planctomycetes bacterium]|nr:DUF3592 domain-containing protein [Planctomycetota bacterium]
MRRVSRTPWTVLLVASIVVTGVGVHGVLNGPRYPASTVGLLDPERTERQVRRRRTRHKVQYSFSVEGRTYRGADTVSKKPTTRQCTVFYEPTDPRDNALSSMKTEAWALVTVAVGLLGALVAMLGATRRRPDGARHLDRPGRRAAGDAAEGGGRGDGGRARGDRRRAPAPRLGPPGHPDRARRRPGRPSSRRSALLGARRGGGPAPGARPGRPGPRRALEPPR